MNSVSPSDAKEILSLQTVAGKGVTVERIGLPAMGENEVEIRPLVSYISAGTELSSVIRQASAQPGAFKPGRLGYSQCGVVVRAGAKVRGVSAGDRVVAIGEGAFHAERTIVAQNLVVPLPDGILPKTASLAAMFCFAIEGVHKSAVRIGESVVVFGAGMMGQMAARLYQLSGARVCVLDSNDYRLSCLPDGLQTFRLDEEGWAGLEQWSKPYGIEHVSVCFGGEATAVIERIKKMMSTAPDGVPHGRMVFPGGAKVTLLMASNMGNIELISSAKAGPGYRDAVFESGVDYPAVYVRHNVRRNVQTMLLLLEDGRLDIDKLVTHCFKFANALEAYAMLQEPNVEALAVVLDYETP